MVAASLSLSPQAQASGLKLSAGLYSSARIFWKQCALSGNEVPAKSKHGVIFLRLLFSKWRFAWDNQRMRSAECGARDGRWKIEDGGNHETPSPASGRNPNTDTQTSRATANPQRLRAAF